jgi:membrane peptidoglycan carboxypeptidase
MVDPLFLVPSPLTFSPAFPDRALARRNFVLQLMLDEQFISSSEYDHAIGSVHLPSA